MRNCCVALGFLLALLLGRDAWADSCARPDLLEVFPQDESPSVPANALLSAHYFTSAEYDDEPIVLEEEGGERRELLGNYSTSEGILSLDPQGFLKPNMAYTVEWPSLRGIGSASRGRGATLRFSVGDVLDTDAPSFGGVLQVSHRLVRDQEGCSNSVQERFLFDLELGSVADETDPANLAIIVFQVDRGTTSSPIPVYTGRFPVSQRLEVARPVDQAVGEVCFAALVRDLAGQVSASTSQVRCTKTVKPPYFHGCSLTRSASSANPREWVGLWVALLTAGAFRLRRENRRARTAG